MGRQAFHHLPELSGDDDVGGFLSTVRTKVFPLEMAVLPALRAWRNDSSKSDSSCVGHKFSVPMGVSSAALNVPASLVRVTIQTLVPFTLGTLYRPRQQVLVRVYQGNDDAFHEGTKCHMRVVSVRRSLTQRVP